MKLLMSLKHSKALCFISISLVILLMPATGFSAVFHVSTAGTKVSGASTPDNWSSSNCYRTIQGAIDRMSGGDEVIVDDGTYQLTNENFISTNYSSPPSGSSGAPTVIRARNTLGVRIENGGDINYYDAFVYLSGVQYVTVKGFVYVCSDSTPVTMFAVLGSYNTVSDCIAVRKGGMDDFGSCFYVSGSYNLVENCSATGHTRYLFETGGPSSTTKYIIFRRCIARTDYSDSNQPMSGFCHYGNNSGTNTNNILWQNCIAIDGQQCDTGSGVYSYIWGGFYFPKNAYQNTLQGCIVLNQDSYYGGFTPIENSGGQLKLEHCISWDNSNSKGGGTSTGINLRGSGSGVTMDHCTIGKSSRAIYNGNAGGSKVLTNNLLWDNGSAGTIGSWGTNENNAASPSSHAPGSGAVAADKLSYLTKIDSDSSLADAGNDGKSIGATVMHAHGKTGTYWGQSGYDKLQDGSSGQATTALWPWPNEDAIKAVFSETNAPNSGAVPSTNNTKRGFCATGKQLNGQDTITLTSYIWEYLGNPMPSDIYSGETPAGDLDATTVRVIDE